MAKDRWLTTRKPGDLIPRTGAPVTRPTAPPPIGTGVPPRSDVLQISPQVGTIPAGGIADLPMDEASRAARAAEQGFNIDSYHGTREDFAVFEKGDLGYHFGTPEQASTRLEMTHPTEVTYPGLPSPKTATDLAGHGTNENIIPVKLRLHNPLELPDVGHWQRPEVIIRRALQTKWGESHAGELQELHDAAEELSAQFSDINEWVDSPESSEIMGELRDMIKEDGYDGIKYRNIVETKYGKEGGGLTVEGQKQYEALNEEWHEIRRQIQIRNQSPPPLGATQEEVQAWIDRKGEIATPEEKARMDQLSGLKELVRKNESYDPHSYIVFDSKNIRSRFAEFDPAQSESPDISKAHGGFVDKPLYERTL
jgi:hypothetical protein